MSEPEYTYVRGEGWVAKTIARYEFEHSGKRFVLEHRVPNIGERFLYFGTLEPTVEILKQVARSISVLQALPSTYPKAPTPEHNSHKVVTYREL